MTTLALMLCMMSISAQTEPIELKLWPNGAPNTNGISGPEEIPDPMHVRNVSDPTLTVYPAQHPTGQVIIACPGGAYMNLAIAKEGHDMAKWMNHMGVTFCVLKYRLPNGHFDATVSDVLQAVKIAREHAGEWKADPSMIGVMGCSAGGNLAIQAATQWTGPENRPDFQVLLYAFTTMNPFINKIMMGENPSEEEILKYTVINHITKDTPPAFITCCADDPVVPCTDSVDMFTALRKFSTEASLHIYPKGGHGFGYSEDFAYKRQWTSELEMWLRAMLQNR